MDNTLKCIYKYVYIYTQIYTSCECPGSERAFLKRTRDSCFTMHVSIEETLYLLILTKILKDFRVQRIVEY